MSSRRGLISLGDLARFFVVMRKTWPDTYPMPSFLLGAAGDGVNKTVATLPLKLTGDPLQTRLSKLEWEGNYRARTKPTH